MKRHPWLHEKVYADFTQAALSCDRCGCATNATGAPEVLRGVVERFREHHRKCQERKGASHGR